MRRIILRGMGVPTVVRPHEFDKLFMDIFCWPQVQPNPILGLGLLLKAKA